MSHEDFNQELDALRENLPELVEGAGPSTKSVQRIDYSIDLAKRICDWSAQGKTLHWISQQSEMPSYPTLQKWSKDHPELSKMLRSVRESRARHFEDEAIRSAEEAQGKDADRLKVETYKWAAEVNDPTVYGKKVAHSGDVGVTTKIIKIVTGFGPLPEALQFPKLNADGTMQKPAEKPVESEVASVEQHGGLSHEETPGRDPDERAAGETSPVPPGHADSSSVYRPSDGAGV